MTIDFKGTHYPKDVILHAVFFYVRYAVSYRDLEEILAERGVAVDHTVLSQILAIIRLIVFVGHSYPARAANCLNGH